MRLVLVNPSQKDVYFPLGLTYIASYLERYGGLSDIKVLDGNVEDIDRGVKKYKPDIIAVSATSKDFSRATRLADKVKLKHGIPLMLGGVHISLLPDSLPKSFDVGIIGEGEQTSLELMQTFEKHGSFKKSELEKIDGIVFNDGKNMVITKPRKPIQPLDIIPYPKRDLFNIKYYLNTKLIRGIETKDLHMLTSRGCPYRCVFCPSSALWKGIRFFSPEYVVGEIKELVEKYKVEHISMYDDLFALDKKRLEKIAEIIIREKLDERVMISCQGRANIFTEEICRILKSMNVIDVGFGFESGSERMLSYLKGNSVTVEQNRKAIKICKKYGLKAVGFFMVGSPGETREDIEKTIEFIKKNPIDEGFVTITTPFPGTDVWDYAANKGLLKEPIDWDGFDFDFAKEYEKGIVLSDKISRKELFGLMKRAQKEIDEKRFISDAMFPSLLRPSSLIDINLWKRVASNPRKSVYALYKVLRYKINHKNVSIKTHRIES